MEKSVVYKAIQSLRFLGRISCTTRTPRCDLSRFNWPFGSHPEENSCSSIFIFYLKYQLNRPLSFIAVFISRTLLRNHETCKIANLLRNGRVSFITCRRYTPSHFSYIYIHIYTNVNKLNYKNIRIFICNVLINNHHFRIPSFISSFF